MTKPDTQPGFAPGSLAVTTRAVRILGGIMIPPGTPGIVTTEERCGYVLFEWFRQEKPLDGLRVTSVPVATLGAARPDRPDVYPATVVVGEEVSDEEE